MTAIEFNNISKQYRLGLVSSGTLSHDLNRWWTTRIRGKEDPYLKIGETNDRSHKGDSDYIWALKDIDFKVNDGDVLGIIGRNGAGKSTLLKILSKVTTPTTGSIKAKGRIASLLEVGTGFHPEMTGRENIFMNGAIMGMTKPEIAAKLDEIVDFSGCERYLDTPTKRYSSGMTVRLGFAIAAHLDPEILVVDEVLAVGDAEFQKKAIGKMKDVASGDGRTVLFVSHNMASIKALCNKGVLLNNGGIETTGLIGDVVSQYLNIKVDETFLYKDTFSVKKSLLSINNFTINQNRAGGIRPQNNQIKIELAGNVKEDLFIGLEARIFDRNRIPLMFFSPHHYNGKSEKISKGNFELSYEINLPENMNQGTYLLNVYITDPGKSYYALSEWQIEINVEGFVTKGGNVFQYTGDNGLLFLH